MGRLGVSKVRALGTRHPGLVQKVDAMFSRFASFEAVTAMIRAEYGERISPTTVGKYKTQWSLARKREQARRAAMTAREELVREGRI